MKDQCRGSDRNLTSIIDPRSSDLRYSRRRYFVDRFLVRSLTDQGSGGGLLLDLGGNKTQKRGQFEYSCCPLNVIYADLTAVKLPDLQADASALPFVDGSFDMVLCAEVLEHVYKPEAAIKEVYRVMKPGGLLLVTVPFLVQEHAHPCDFGRYTGTFWAKLLAEVGFTDVQIERHGGFWVVIVEMLTAYILQKSDAGELSRLWYPALASLLVWARKRALRKEGEPGNVHTILTQSFTTGFGISCRKQM